MHLNLAGLIPIIGGIYGILLACRVIPVGKDPKKAADWQNRYGTLVLVLSPIIIISGCLNCSA